MSQYDEWNWRKYLRGRYEQELASLHPSDFREELSEAAYQRWCGDNQCDPEATESALAYEDYFDNHNL